MSHPQTSVAPAAVRGSSPPPLPGPPDGVPVTVNVYTLMSRDSASTRVPNDVLDVVGMSIYHAGVELLGEEWSFGMDPSGRPDPNIDGVFSVPPRKAVGNFKEAVLLGYLPKSFSRNDAQRAVAGLRQTWRAVTYHILERNCCHFAKEMALSLNPEFKRTFPDYVSRAAKVGSTVVPDVLIAKVTEMVAPPPAIPPALANIVDIPYNQPRPSARPPPAPSQSPPPQQPVSQPPAKKSGGLGGLLKSAAKATVAVGRLAANTVGDAVGHFVTESDRSSFAEKFPQQDKARLVKHFTCSVNYCHREYPADLYIASDCLCLTGPPSLHLVIPMSDIEQIHPARFLPPPAPRLPPGFETVDEPAAAGENPAFLIWRRSRRGMVTPIFLVRTMTSGVSERVTAAAGMVGQTKTAETMELVERLWHQSMAGTAPQ